MNRREGFGYIYVATNPTHSNIVKIGKTANPSARVKQLSSHPGVPEPFRFIFCQRVYDYHRVERLIHRAFNRLRNSKNREFFRLHPQAAVTYVKLLINTYESEQKKFLGLSTPLGKALFESRLARGEAPLGNKVFQNTLRFADSLLDTCKSPNG